LHLAFKHSPKLVELLYSAARSILASEAEWNDRPVNVLCPMLTTRNNSGDTALHVAMKCQRWKESKKILKEAPSVYLFVVDNDAKNPVDLARKAKSDKWFSQWHPDADHAEVIKTLEKRESNLPLDEESKEVPDATDVEMRYGDGAKLRKI